MGRAVLAWCHVGIGAARRISQRDEAVPVRLALTRLVEIVGEAAGRVSPEAQARFPRVPWREAIATRHRITHGYDVVDYDILWDTVQDDFPPLVAALEKALGNLR